MLSNYLRIAMRFLFRNKIFLFLNVIGLTLGIVGCLLILQYVSYELSFDAFHEHSENIYRVKSNYYIDGKLLSALATSVPAVGPAMKDNFPAVLEYARALPKSGIISYKEKSFRERKIQIVTPSFLTMFTFPLIEGNPETALEEPNTCVITETTARKYFGSDDAIGKTITWNNEIDLTITGVMKNVPENSHIKFSLLLSFKTITESRRARLETDWSTYSFHTYVQLRPGTVRKEFDATFAQWLEQERGQYWKSSNKLKEFLLQPLEDIHLYSHLGEELNPQENGDWKQVYALFVLAFLVLIVALVNTINMASARAMERAREVGTRKVLGASRAQLIIQFLFESLLNNLFAFFLSIILIILLFPYYKQMTGHHLDITMLLAGRFWITLIGLFVSVTFLAGLYPAFVLSSFKPVAVLKGRLVHSRGRVTFRKILIVIQFIASLGLIAGTLTIYNQLNYMMKQDIGINIDQTLVVYGPEAVDSTYNSTLDAFRAEILSNPNIERFTISSCVPGNEIIWGSRVRKLGDSDKSDQLVKIIGIDDEYIPAFQIQLLAGRNFTKKRLSDLQAVIINKYAVSLLGFKNPQAAIDSKVMFPGGQEREIIGVIDNYNHMSVKTHPPPLMLRYPPTYDHFYSFKYTSGDMARTIDSVRAVWNRFFPGNPFEYYYLDDFYNQQYRSEKRTSMTNGIFSLMAIIISSLGLFGLSAFSAVQRTKEIAIRKVVGASVGDILFLLSKEYLFLITISMVIAWPAAYYIMVQWLQQFAARISISWMSFALSGISVMLVSWLAVSYNTIRAARSNPINALKYE